MNLKYFIYMFFNYFYNVFLGKVGIVDIIIRLIVFKIKEFRIRVLFLKRCYNEDIT